MKGRTQARRPADPRHAIRRISLGVLAAGGVLGWILPLTVPDLSWLPVAGAAVTLAAAVGLILALRTARRKAGLEHPDLEGEYLPWGDEGSAVSGMPVGTEESLGLESVAWFTRRVAAEVARATRHSLDLALLTLAADPPDEGMTRSPDQMATIAEIVRNAVRTSDSHGRLRDGRLGVVLPETDGAGARRAAEKLRRAVEVYPFPSGTVTVSVGGARREAGDTGASLMERAVSACEAAAASGGNTVNLSLP